MIDYWQILPHLFLLKRLVFKIFVGFSGTTIYRAGGSISRQIINAAIDLKVKCVFLQIANRSKVAQIIKGDVVANIVEQMPIEFEVLIRA